MIRRVADLVRACWSAQWQVLVATAGVECAVEEADGGTGGDAARAVGRYVAAGEWTGTWRGASYGIAGAWVSC